MAREELKLKMPGKLKKYLITDWEAITKNEQVRAHIISLMTRR